MYFETRTEVLFFNMLHKSSSLIPKKLIECASKLLFSIINSYP